MAPGEELAVLEGVVVLGEGHRPAVVPDVDDVGDAAHESAAALTGEDDLVDVRLVQVVLYGEAQLGRTADAAAGITLRADPDGERRAPVAASREVPVDKVLQPVAHASVADVRRLPSHRSEEH